jgi:hypothetical protein
MPERLQTPAELAAAIRQAASQAHSEEDLRIGVEKLLEHFLEKYGIKRSKYETATRVDAQHGNLFIEYERPGKLARPAERQKSIAQITGYLLREATKYGQQATAALRKMRGVSLDGESIIFVRYIGKRSSTILKPAPAKRQLGFFPEAQAAEFYVSDLFPVGPESIETFLASLRALAREPLTPEALAETFGPKGKESIAAAVVTTLYNKLQNTSNRRVQTFFAEWQRIFGIVYGQDVGKAEADARAFAKLFGLPKAPELKPFLFCVHTYFALLMKLLCAEIMSLQQGALTASFLADLPSLTLDEFKRKLRHLEEGGLYRELGINNFLEADFFAWYLGNWDKRLGDSLRNLVRRLANFEAATPYLAPEQSRDLLKKLYQYLVPRKLRHDLGEYYTPDWLAEHLLNQLGYDGNLDKRLLDPACGSGTFLVLAVNRMRDWAATQEVPTPPETLARRILDNLCGFDLNPIAVIAARTNFLLAMGDLIRYARPIEIPIYMCDSVLTPAEYTEELFKDYKLPTVAGEFVIPREIVEQRQTEKLAALLEECVRTGYSDKEFVKRAEQKLEVKHEAALQLLAKLYRAIAKLEQEGRNGIWARFLKNAFAPIFKGKFDFVAGNPPWINWESLSDEYRRATWKLWDKYGLFSLKGHAARLGGGKKDFSMLFTYAAADNYLTGSGKLGFLVTQTAFHTKGAGAGFRRFTPRGTSPLKVLLAEDLVSVKPFEGASNWTGAIVLRKGEATSYPIEYVRWCKTKKGALSQEATLEMALQSCARTRLMARPVSDTDATSPWQIFSSVTATPLNKISGKSSYVAKAGITTWLDGVFWVRVLERRPDGLLLVENMPEMGKKNIGSPITASIEPELVHPFVRWEDIHRFSATAAHCILVTQDRKTRKGIEEPTMKSRAPHTFAYLKRFEHYLRKRSGFLKYFHPKRDPFYSVYNVSDDSFSPLKAIWKTMGTRIEATVLAPMDHPGLPPKVPFHKNTVMFIPLKELNEARYVVAVLNSLPVTFAAKSYSVSGGKGFGASSLLEHIAIPKFEPADSLHTNLARLSQRAHELAARLAANPADEDAKQQLAEVEDQVDRAAAQLWGLTDVELEEIRNALELLS